MSSPSNWTQYIDILDKKKIPERARRWYVHHVENFLNLHKGKHLRAFGAADVESYLGDLSRNPKIRREGSSIILTVKANRIEIGP